MQRLEEALRDLAEQDERLPTSELIARIERQVSSEGDYTVVALDGRSAMDTHESTRQGQRRRWVPAAVAVGAALLVLIVVGLPIVFLSNGGGSTIADQPATTLPPVVTTVPPTTVADPPPTTAPSVDESPPPEDADVAPDAGFDYASIGEAVGTLDTAFGTLSWYQKSSLSGELLGAGFPGPFRHWSYDLGPVFAGAPCCLEVFEGTDGYLGLGSTDGPDEPRIIADHLDDLFRVRGVETAKEFRHLRDTGAPPDDFEIWSGDRWHFYSDDWGETFVYREFSFAPDEVWFSQDGSSWEQRADSPFGTDVAMVSQPDSVAEHDGTWMVLGWSGVEDLADVADPYNAVGATGAAWMSDDLETWTPVPFDFGSPGVDTTLLLVVAGDGGWLIIGERISQETPVTHESVVWFSPDGLAWSELPMGGFTGLPGCGSSEGTETCLDRFYRAAFIPNGIALYGYTVARGEVQTVQGTHPWGWRLWIGVWED